MKKLFAVAMAAAFIGTQAQALSLNLSDNPAVNGNDVMKFSSPPTVKILGPNSGTFYAGAFSLLADDATTATIEAQAFDTYCVDVLHYLQPFNNPYGDSSLTSYGIVNATGLRQLWYTHLGDSLTTAAKSAAFQLAVWELTYDSTFNLTAGNFKVDSSYGSTASLIAQANTYWTTVGTMASTSLVVLNDLGNNQNKQAVLWETTPGQGNPVPEPVTVGFAALGLAAALRRRNRK